MNRRKPFTLAELAIAKKMWACGESVRVIAAALQRPHGTVAAAIRMHPTAFPSRKPHGSAKAKAASLSGKAALPTEAPEKMRVVVRLGVSLPAMSWDLDAA